MDKLQICKIGSYLFDSGLYDVQLITSTDSACLGHNETNDFRFVGSYSVVYYQSGYMQTASQYCKYFSICFNLSVGFWDAFVDKWITSSSVFRTGFLCLARNSSFWFRLYWCQWIPDYRYPTTSKFTIYWSCLIPAIPWFHLQNLSQDAIAYRWNFGDGDSSSEISPSHIYALAGTIPVQLTSISSFGCESTFEKSVYFVSFKEARFSTEWIHAVDLFHLIR